MEIAAPEASSEIEEGTEAAALATSASEDESKTEGNQ